MMINNGVVGHLTELRNRLLWVLSAVILGAVVAYSFKDITLHIVLQPVLVHVHNIVFTGIPDIFFTHLKIAVYAGIFAGFPMLMFQIWKFMAPGLLGHEKRIIGSLFLLAPLLLYGGAVFAHQLVMPLAVEFFFSFQTETLSALPAIQPVLAFILKLTLAFALAFTLPLWVLLLVKLNIVSPQKLAKGRRYVLVGVFILAAIMTPPDPASQLLLALPLYVLFEISIFLSKFLVKK